LSELLVSLINMMSFTFVILSYYQWAEIPSLLIG
jgi:hypothetical protein